MIIVLNHLEHPDMIMVTEVDRMNPPMARLTVKLPGAVLFGLLVCVPGFPQHLISAKAGNVQFIQGEVFMNGTSIRLQDGQYIQMENDQVLTTGTGYAEILLTPSAYLRLGEQASFRMRQNELAAIRLELNQGSALIEILEKLKTDPIRMHISGNIIEMKKEGLYRLDAGARNLRVYGGDARVIQGKKKVRVKNGRMVSLDGELRPVKFDASDADALHHWAARRSFDLYAKNLFFTRPRQFRMLPWRSKPEGMYSPQYRVTVAANEDWTRYWIGVWNSMQRQANRTIRRMLADPGSIHRPPPLIPVPPEEQP